MASALTARLSASAPIPLGVPNANIPGLPKNRRSKLPVADRFLVGCAFLCALGGLFVPSFASSLIAQTQATPPGMPAGMTTVPYVYKGTSFEIRIYLGQVLMVIQNGLPVVMYARGTARSHWRRCRPCLARSRSSEGIPRWCPIRRCKQCGTRRLSLGRAAAILRSGGRWRDQVADRQDFGRLDY